MVYYSAMRKRKQKASLSRTGSIAPFVACFLLFIALLGIFCWRVVSTDPSWNMERMQPQPKVEQNVPSTPPTIVKQVSSAPAEPETVVELPVRTGAKSTPKHVETEAPKVDPEQISAYLATHLGQKIPLLRNGVKRDVVLAAFTDDQIMVRAGSDDLTTISRASLDAAQLRLWK